MAGPERRPFIPFDRLRYIVVTEDGGHRVALSGSREGSLRGEVSVYSESSKAAGVSVVQAVDLFCGIGGLTHGLRAAGVNVGVGVDIDASCGFAYEANNPGSAFWARDIRQLAFADLAPFYAGARIRALVGCAPCQPYSSHNRKLRGKSNDDCALVGEFARLVSEGLPEVVSMENVPGLARHDSFHEFLDILDALDYEIDHGIVSCLPYGVPQKRKRLVVLASRGRKLPLPRPTNQTLTVADALRGLPSLQAGEMHPSDPDHVTLPLSERNQRRIRQSRPGGTWRDWDDQDINRCHKRAHFPASYGRMRWDQPAPTITTQFCYYSTGRFGHPDQDRTISIREGALLQTFPKDYSFTDGRSFPPVSKLARHIGNAVPVALANAIGKAISEASHVH